MKLTPYVFIMLHFGNNMFEVNAWIVAPRSLMNYSWTRYAGSRILTIFRWSFHLLKNVYHQSVSLVSLHNVFSIFLVSLDYVLTSSENLLPSIYQPKPYLSFKLWLNKSHLENQVLEFLLFKVFITTSIVLSLNLIHILQFSLLILCRKICLNIYFTLLCVSIPINGHDIFTKQVY